MSNFLNGNGDGNKTQNAGTIIQYTIPPTSNAKTRVTSLVYLDSGTSHTLTFMRTLGRTTASGVNAAAQAVLNIVADPGSAAVIYGGVANVIAANDFLAVRESDGITRTYKVSSVSSLAITLTANLTTGTKGGESVWWFGITSDTDGVSGLAHPALKGGAGSANVTFTDRDNGIIATYRVDEPILLNSNNATNAGTIVQLSWGYTPY